jgi:hypothetical protein
MGGALRKMCRKLARVALKQKKRSAVKLLDGTFSRGTVSLEFRLAPFRAKWFYRAGWLLPTFCCPAAE